MIYDFLTKIQKIRLIIKAFISFIAHYRSLFSRFAA